MDVEAGLRPRSVLVGLVVRDDRDEDGVTSGQLWVGSVRADLVRRVVDGLGGVDRYRMLFQVQRDQELPMWWLH